MHLSQERFSLFQLKKMNGVILHQTCYSLLTKWWITSLRTQEVAFELVLEEGWCQCDTDTPAVRASWPTAQVWVHRYIKISMAIIHSLFLEKEIPGLVRASSSRKFKWRARGQSKRAKSMNRKSRAWIKSRVYFKRRHTDEFSNCSPFWGKSKALGLAGSIQGSCGSREWLQCFSASSDRCSVSASPTEKIYSLFGKALRVSSINHSRSWRVF